MPIKSLLTTMAERLPRRLARLPRDRRGGVAVMFGASVAPMMIMVFVASDMHQISLTKGKLQDALDAATLQAARSDAVTETDLQKIGMAGLTANTVNIDGTLKAAAFAPASSSDATTVTGTATMRVKPLVLNSLVGQEVDVRAASEVRRARSKLEIALVLDVTGSMMEGNPTKLSSLKTAATKLVDDLAVAAAKNGADKLKISLVPFSNTVNIGAGLQGQSWLVGTMPAEYGADIFNPRANRFTLFSALKDSSNKSLAWGGCVESRPAPYDVQDTAPNASVPGTLFVPYFAPDEPDWKQSGSSTNEKYLNNYLTSATSPSQQTANNDWAKITNNNARYTGKIATGKSYWGNQFANGGAGWNKGPNFGCDISPLIRLTNNTSTVKTAINDLVASGETNIPMGLVWGWHTLSPNLPFGGQTTGSGAAYTDKETKKVIILMTDGNNSNYSTGTDGSMGLLQSIYSGLGYARQGRVGQSESSSATQRTALMDGRLTTLCNNIRNAKITIFAVRVEVNDTTNQTLKTCVGDDTRYQEVAKATNLSAAFTKIIGAIEMMRISK